MYTGEKTNKCVNVTYMSFDINGSIRVYQSYQVVSKDISKAMDCLQTSGFHASNLDDWMTV